MEGWTTLPAGIGEQTAEETAAAMAYARLVATGDVAGATALLRAEHATAPDGSLASVLVRTALPAQSAASALVAQGAWSPADEHAAGATSERAVRAAAADLPRPEGRPVLVSCVETEWHSVPALAAGVALREAGTPVEHVGSHTSPDLLLRRVRDADPRAVLLCVGRPSSLARAEAQVAALTALGVPVVLGGRALDAEGRRARLLGARVAARDPRQLPGLVDALDGAATRGRRPAAPARTVQAQAAARLRAEADRLVTDVLLEAGLGLRAPTASGAADGSDAELGGTVPRQRPRGPRARPDEPWPVVAATGVRHLLDAVASSLVVGEQLVADEQAALARALARAGGPAGAAPALSDLLRDRLRTTHPEAARLLGAG